FSQDYRPFSLDLEGARVYCREPKGSVFACPVILAIKVEKWEFLALMFFPDFVHTAEIILLGFSLHLEKLVRQHMGHFWAVIACKQFHTLNFMHVFFVLWPLPVSHAKSIAVVAFGFAVRPRGPEIREVKVKDTFFSILVVSRKICYSHPVEDLAGNHRQDVAANIHVEIEKSTGPPFEEP